MTSQQIIHGDCQTLSHSFDDSRQYDVLICDPPYSKHVHEKAMSQSASRGTRKRDLGFDSLSHQLRFFIATTAARKIKRWSLIYSDIEGLGPWRSEMEIAGAEYIRHIPWIRWSAPQLSGDRPPSGCEFVTAYHNASTKKQWNGPGNLLSLNHKCLRGEDKHKAEKPLDQALDLVNWFSNPGEHVLDLTAGNGTVGLASKLLGRSYTGYEIDKAWADKASLRLESPLSDRDTERYHRWDNAHAIELEERKRMTDHTASVRAKFEAKKLYGDVR
jgi:DNA modification methylase